MANARIDLGLYGQDTDLKTKLDGAKRSIEDLRELGKNVGLGLKDDEFKVKLLEAERKLDTLDRKVARPSIKVEGADKSVLEIAKVGLALDDLKRKSDDLSKSNGLFSKLVSLFPGGNKSSNSSGAESGGAFGEALPILGGLGGGLAAALLPSLSGLIVGAGVGGLGAYGAIDKNAGLQKQGTGILDTLLGTTSVLVKPLAGLFSDIDKQVKILSPDLRAMFSASMPFITAFAGVMLQSAKVIIPAFTETMKTMISSGALKEMMLALTELTTDGLVPFLKVMGPGFKASADVFRATVLTVDGVLVGIGGIAMVIARMLGIMGHATGDAGKAFFDIGRVIAALLTGNWTALKDAVAAMGNNFRNFFASLADELDVGFIKLSDFGHDVASVFDTMRSDVASTWDATWSAVFGALKSGVQQDINYIKSDFWDALTNAFDNIRHSIAGIWNLVWNDTIGATQRGASRVESGFGSLLSSIRSTMGKLPGDLLNLGKEAISDLWSGLKSGASSITNWISGFAKGVIGVIKKVFGIFSPSRAFFDIGSSLMHGLSLGIQSKASAVSGALGNVSAGVKRWASTVQEALKLNNLPLSLTSRVLYQMQTESGGNPMAINLTDINASQGHPSQGLMQVIPSTFAAYHVAGTSMDIDNPLANIAAAINYGKHVYGPSLMRDGMGIGSGHGYALGGIISEPIIGVGLRSAARYSFGENGPETVVPGRHYGGGVGGDTYIINPPDSATNPDAYGLALIQAIRSYKKHHGNQPTGVG